jgi:uncharacterized protein
MLQRLVFSAVFILTTALLAQQKSPTEQLESAIYANDAAQIKAAVKAGANPNGGSYYGHYLGIAATGNYDKAVKALVESGAEVNKTSSRGGWTAAMGAADNGHLAVLKYLASQKADLNARTRQGRTLLMRSAYHGKTEVVQYLISKGVKVADVDNNGVTALMLAAQQGHDKTVKVLLDAGSSKAAETSSKKTALILAKESEKANGTYRADEFKRTIALLSGAEKKALGKLIGKVFSAEGKKLVITGKGIGDLAVGSKLKIKTASGEIAATVKEVLHSKVKATAAKAGAEKGDAVHLDK